MFWIIVVLVAVLVVLFKLGIFRKPGVCKCCGKNIKGTEQVVFNGSSERFILCKECAAKIHPQIMKYAKDNWSYEDYTTYLAWDEATREERAAFKPTNTYGYNSALMVDMEHGLFTLGKSRIFKENENGLVLRFADVNDFDIDFKPEQVKEGLISDKATGTEYAMVEMACPRVVIEETLNASAKYRLKQKGFFSSHYSYEIKGAFLDIIQEFTFCLWIEEAKQSGNVTEENQNFDEVQKALALFMFDSMADVTEDNLKKQRNSLIKAFHPDGGEDNASYAQKINTAYDLLFSLVRNKEG